VTRRPTRFMTIMAVGSSFACLTSAAARAQNFSNHDGYTEGGSYRVQLEVSPYLWLPATSGKIGFARQAVANHISGAFGTAVPSLAGLANTLHFSFMGDTVLRYGPYSAETDIQYISASKSTNLPSGLQAVFVSTPRFCISLRTIYLSVELAIAVLDRRMVRSASAPSRMNARCCATVCALRRCCFLLTMRARNE
jgi:hypothetical protein